MLLKRYKKSLLCNLTDDTNNKKQLDLTLFPSQIEKRLGKYLTSTEIDEHLFEQETVNITYNNHNVIISIIANSNSEESDKEQDTDCENCLFVFRFDVFCFNFVWMWDLKTKKWKFQIL